MDRDRPSAHLLHQPAEGPGHHRLRVHRHTSTADYEEDHLVPLELGGSPTATTNLWPEPYSGTKTAYTKEGVETKLKNAVCAGTITLALGVLAE
jgi:hypothetical protein